MPSVKVGVVAPTREEVLFPSGKAGSPDAGSVVTFAARAEELGFDSVWVGESLLARPRFEPLTLLAAMAANTSRITVGTAVLLPALRHPLQVAQAVATVDQLAQGRLVLGVGAGAPVPGTEAELTALGVPMGDRAARVVEAADLMRALWRGPLEGWESGRWPLPRVDIGVRPYSQGGPPLWLGGDAPATLERAGRHFDGWLPFTPAPEGYSSGWKKVCEAAERAGRTRGGGDGGDGGALVPALYLNLSLDDDPECARLEQAAHLGAYYGVDPVVMTRLQASHAGTVGSALEWVEGFVAAGARHLVLRLTTRTPAAQLDAAACFAAAVRGLSA